MPRCSRREVGVLLERASDGGGGRDRVTPLAYCPFGSKCSLPGSAHITHARAHPSSWFGSHHARARTSLQWIECALRHQTVLMWKALMPHHRYISGLFSPVRSRPLDSNHMCHAQAFRRHRSAPGLSACTRSFAFAFACLARATSAHCPPRFQISGLSISVSLSQAI